MMENLAEILPDQQTDEAVLLHRRKSRRAYWLHCLRHLKRLPIEDWDDSVYIVTNKRVVCQQNGQRNELFLEKLTDVDYKMPDFPANLGNYGDVLIKARDAAPLLLQTVDRPRQFQQKVIESIDQSAAAQVGIEYPAYRRIVEADLLPEEIVVVFRKHPWFLLKAIAIPASVLCLTGSLSFLTAFDIRVLPEIIRGSYLIFLSMCLFWLWWRVENWRNDKLILTAGKIEVKYGMPLGLYEQRTSAPLAKVNEILVRDESAMRLLGGYGTVVLSTKGGGVLQYSNVVRPDCVRREILRLLTLSAARRLEIASNEREESARQFSLNRFLQAIDRDWIDTIEPALLTDQVIALQKTPVAVQNDLWVFDPTSTWLAQSPNAMTLLSDRLARLGLTACFLAAANMTSAKWEAMGYLAEGWILCQTTNDIHELSVSLNHLHKRIAAIMGADYHPGGPIVDPRADFFGLLVSVRTLFEDLDFSPILPCVYVRSSRVDMELDALRHLLSDLMRSSNEVGRFVILIPILTQTKSLALEQLLYEELRPTYAIDSVVLGYGDFLRMILSRDAASNFRKRVLSRADLSTLSKSVFVITGPVRDRSFFGRESEMRGIVEHVARTAFAVIGGRRIGKTSLLRHLHRFRLPAAGFDTIYHDCSTTANYYDFVRAVADDWSPAPPSNTLVTFADVLKTGLGLRRLVLLLDEADELVPSDQADGWRLFKELRALVNSGRLQVVFCGERSLRDALRDPTSPMYNFANEILLGPLDVYAAGELITRPMKQLGIELVNENAIVESIWRFTSGHPNVIQRLCRRLLGRLGQQSTRCLTLDLVQSEIKDPGFQRDDFLATYWQQATPLERILSLLLVDQSKPCSLQSIRTALQSRCGLKPTAQEVDGALQRLVDLRCLLRHTQQGYDFAVQAFPIVVGNTMTLTDMLEILTEEYQERGE